MFRENYSVTYPWAPQDAQVTTVGLSLVVTRFMAVHTWHCTLEIANVGSLTGGTCPGNGGASGGKGSDAALNPKRSLEELASLPMGLTA